MTNATALSITSNDNSIKMKKTVLYKVKNSLPSIQTMVQNAAKIIAPVWPLENFIACNPLQGFEAQMFEKALEQGEFKRQKSERNLAMEAVNLQMIKWCAAFFDAGQSAIEMPHRDKGFYFGFLKLVRFDKKLHQNKKESKKWLANLPENPEETISLCLQKLEVSQEKTEEFLTQTLLCLPGWAGFVKWKTEWHNPKETDEQQVTFIDFLAVRLVITCLLWPDAAKHITKEKNASFVKEMMRQLKNNEDIFRDKLVASLLPELTKSAAKTKRRADAQLVFCIDVRSEPLRRAIEQTGNYETFGFAGFFGLPVRIKEYDSGKVKDGFPVLLKPRFHIDETPQPSDCCSIEKHRKGKEIRTTVAKVYQQLKYNFSTPFALVESLGIWCGMNMLFKSLAPGLSKRWGKSVRQVFAPDIRTQPALESNPSDLEKGIPLNEQIAYGEMVLRLMGLTSGFAKLIILCGHGSSTENNPYASALDCGACGGNHGDINARLLAAILNKQEVRRALEDKGIHIPLDTLFHGALHNTTTDSVEIYPLENNRVIYPAIFNQLQIDLNHAKLTNNADRIQKLNGKAAAAIDRRSMDWSETRPEWGLARNAAFIVAPRWLTKNINLDGRCFLHSYDWQQDEDGALLETILTAPMVVAEWINTQYLFSTLDNATYGSGSKITHNITGKIAVMQGNGSDLMHGLPLQSVMASDDTAYHVPQRLLAVVYAPRERLSLLIAKHDILTTLFLNDWVHLVTIDPIDNQAYRLDTSNDWIKAH